MRTHSTLPPTAAVFDHLSRHIDGFAYTKGQFKGDAPADTSRRGKTHYRVARRSPTHIAVVFHSTDIIRCYAAEPDTLLLDSGGWHDSPTTRQAYWEAPLGPRTPGVSLYSPYNVPTPRPVGSMTAIRGTAFYDGMRVDLTRSHEGHPLQWVPREPKPLMKFVADRPARRAVRAHPGYAEFRQALPLLFDGCSAEGTIYRHSVGQLHLSDFDDPANWPDIIARAASSTRTWNTPSTPEKADKWVYDHLTNHLRITVPA